MAVSVDTVYQRVLALANKEQRGYITPQEFNLYANQVQMDIFEQYFYDLNQFRRLPGNDTRYSDMVDTLEEKISIFKSGPQNRNNGQVVHFSWYKLTDVSYQGKIVREVRFEDYQKIKQSPLLRPNANRPVYWRRDGKIYFDGVFPGENAQCNFIRRPGDVEWNGYDVTGSGALQYNDAASTDFELHQSEETRLVIKILGLAGITLKDPALYQIAGAEDNKNTQQEKQ